jgi:hypothetical protein
MADAAMHAAIAEVMIHAWKPLSRALVKMTASSAVRSTCTPQQIAS